MARRTLTTILRPLAEGLALFAEFDVNTVKSTILTTPLKSTISLFSGRAPGILGQDDMGAGLMPLVSAQADELAISLPIIAKLRQVRLSEAGIKRKVNVLASTVSDSSDVYLLGYLGVKGMWRTLRQKSARLYTETDLTLAYLKGFFYEDRVLIDILLSANNPSERLADRILQRVKQRMHQLSDVTDNDIAEFEQQVLDELPVGSPKWARCLHIDPAGWKRGERSYRKLVNDLFVEPKKRLITVDGNTMADDIRNAFSVLLNRRHIVRLGTMGVHVDVADGGNFVVRLDDRELFRGCNDAAPPQSGEGTIELVFSSLSSSLHRAVVVYGPDSLVDIIMPHMSADDMAHDHERRLMWTDLAPSTKFIELGEIVDRIVRSFVEERELAEQMRIVDIQLPYVIKYLYLDSGLNAVADEQLDGVIKLLELGGVYEALHHDRDLLEALIILGAVAPLMPLRRALLNLLADYGFADPDGMLTSLLRCGEKTGLPLVNADEHYAFVLV
ncbi:hypothetical protein AOZ06_05210 [Kibdelosporangium phytohabitans]|uniref:Uncharacterized protein n=1 Tax=Kibdelosporangium phytohabitans TaxID=860235 RepID=A0A0N9HWY4_9PSEU|nr:hypothetical protein AOZ06_05210 [Kibdelosporangium phytohabitans]